ncbi:MAG: hypothetical protein H7Y42_12225 [Chitinophagaceae bacterium]|nr:hypothetical protein [Chitinophagaceae bacterium]
MQGPEVLIPLTMFAGGFAMIFGIYYLKTRQNLAMIEKNMNPRETVNRPAPYKNLKWALLLIGSGIGLFLAYMLDSYILPHDFVTETYGANTYRHRTDGNPAVYFALIAIGGGIGLFGSYKMEKKWWDENKGNPTV